MLSSIELEVTKRLGMKNHDIGKELGYTRKGVDNLITKVMSKLDQNNRTAAAMEALRKGLLDINDFIIPTRSEY